MLEEHTEGESTGGYRGVTGSERNTGGFLHHQDSPNKPRGVGVEQISVSTPLYLLKETPKLALQDQMAY